jgi:hypothetical protein
MFLQSAMLGAYNFLCARFLIIFCLFFGMIHCATADWNSGATIEDVSTRIAINIVDEGVDITVDLAPKAVNQLSVREPVISLEAFALTAIMIHAEFPLQPDVKSDSNTDNKTSTSGTIIKIFLPFSNSNQPQKIDVIPDFDLIKKAGDQFIITVSHHGLPVIDHAILTQAETLKLDW